MIFPLCSCCACLSPFLLLLVNTSLARLATLEFHLLVAFWCHQSYPFTQMLSRASSDASIRLRRSKSASTVHRHPPPIQESFDPDAAKEQALAAAITAFARAQAQDAADRPTKRNSELSRSKSNTSRKSGAMQGQGSHFPARGSSFRSLQTHGTGEGVASQRLSQPGTVNANVVLEAHLTPNDKPVSAPKPLSAQPSIAFGEHIRPSTQPKVGRQSVSSSITSQQIRKARSMYYASSIQTGSPIARPPTMYLTTLPTVTASSKVESSATVPTTRTLASSPLAEPRIPVIVATDESIDKARDSYLQSFQQRSIKHKPSLFLAPFIKRQDRGKDKSKRISSTFTSVSTGSQHTPGESTFDVSFNDFMPQGEKKDKRSISSSLKSRIKKVFRRPSRPSPRLPVQQIQASRDYFGTDKIGVQDTGDLYAIPSPEDELLRRVRARTPSLEPARPILGRSGSRTSSNGSVQSTRSIRSLHSEVHATNPSVSRMTSWGTTATEDTLAQRAIKRLTVIHESKDSIGSETDRVTSSLTKRKSIPVGALASFRDPMPMESLMEESSSYVDPKRVFSALMKEIETSKSIKPAANSVERTPGADSDVFGSKKTKILHSSARELHSSTSTDFSSSIVSDQRPLSRRASSAATQSSESKTSSFRNLGRAIKSTIRTVTPGDHGSSSYPDQPPSACKVVRIPKGDIPTSSAATIPDADEDCVNINSRSVWLVTFPIVFCTE
jgi:hypothetical protein